MSIFSGLLGLMGNITQGAYNEYVKRDISDGLAVMDAWGFEYKGNIVWEKVRKDGEPDGRGVGFYFRNVMELLLFGIKKKVLLIVYYNQHALRLI